MIIYLIYSLYISWIIVYQFNYHPSIESSSIYQVIGHCPSIQSNINSISYLFNYRLSVQSSSINWIIVYISSVESIESSSIYRLSIGHCPSIQSNINSIFYLFNYRLSVQSSSINWIIVYISSVESIESSSIYRLSIGHCPSIQSNINSISYLFNYRLSVQSSSINWIIVYISSVESIESSSIYRLYIGHCPSI